MNESTMTERPDLTMERTFKATADRVFDAFTSEEVMRRWWHAGADWETPEATVDLRIGGEMRVVMRNPHAQRNYGGGGQYTEIDRPRKLAFTWLWDDDPDQVEQLIEITFTETDGVTTMLFVHRNLWDDEAVKSHRGGWTEAFDNLEAEVQS